MVGCSTKRNVDCSVVHTECFRVVFTEARQLKVTVPGDYQIAVAAQGDGYIDSITRRQLQWMRS